MKCWKERYPCIEVYGAILSNDTDCVGQEGYTKYGDDLYLSCTISLENIEKTIYEDLDNDPPELRYYEPLPSAAWGWETKAGCDLDLWKKIKKYEFDRTYFCCEMCGDDTDGDENSLVLHQRWEYQINDSDSYFRPSFEEFTSMVQNMIENKNDSVSVINFTRFDVLCLSCHDLVHIGKAKCEGRTRNARKHYEDKLVQMFKLEHLKRI
eukprot:gene8060-10918_t